MGFRKPRKAIGLDIGTHTVKAVLVSGSKNRLRLEQACWASVDRNQFSADPVAAQSLAVQEALATMPTSQSLLAASLSGQTVVVRYLRLVDVAKERLADTVAREAANNIPYDLNEVYMDWSVLGEYHEEGRKIVKVLIVAAMRDVVETRLQILQNAEVACSILSVNALALADAGEVCQFFSSDETVAIIDIGLTSSSVQFIKGGVSNFIRDVNWGARELILTVAKAQRCSYEQAVALIEEYSGSSQIPEAIDTIIEARRDGEDVGTAQTVPGNRKPSASPLDPLEDGEDLISIYDPDKKDIRQTDIPVAMVPEKGVLLDEIAMGPLNRLAVELRRSFDYYEHQLYEQPVDRVLLCGGLAEFPPVIQALEEELGFGVIEILSPGAGSVQIPDRHSVAPFLAHPGQFVVALGLAAHGLAEL